jgi:hypothetical protein
MEYIFRRAARARIVLHRKIIRGSLNDLELTLVSCQ